MSQPNPERLVYRAALVVVVLAAFGALFTSKEPETTLLMVSAVITGLVCFDTSMERQLYSRWPWIFISLAPVMKTVPAVWYELKADDGLLVERYDHTGSLLFGVCVLVAIVLLSRPAKSVGKDVSIFDGVVIVGSALTASVAGASVAFLFDNDFGSVQAGRVLETPTWFVIGGLLAAIALAASHTPTLSGPLTALLAAASVAAGLLAFTVAGREVDPGLWALVFAGFAISAGGLGPGVLGARSSRTRRSSAGVAIAILVGAIAAASAISARSDRTAWAPGWAILGVLSLGMFALAMVSRPLDDDQDQAVAASRHPERVTQDSNTQDIGVEHGDASALDLGEVVPLTTSLTGASAPTAEPAEGRTLVRVPSVDKPGAAPALARVTATTAAAPPPGSFVRHVTAALEQTTIDAASTPSTPHVAQPGAAQETRVPNRPVVAPRVEPAAAAEELPAATLPGRALSDAGLVAAARAAVEVRQAPSGQRHSIAPLAQAHHFDPSTGLLSAAGLQHALAAAFNTPRQAGHVTIMMFTIRAQDEIEANFGRLASAAVTREVADRVRKLLPAGTGARFARTAYAVIFVGDLGDQAETVQRLARVLLQLRAPIEGGAVGEKIDVVAGMAQCYEGEDVADFVKRANLGLARAVQNVEPTFVAMP